MNEAFYAHLASQLDAIRAAAAELISANGVRSPIAITSPALPS